VIATQGVMTRETKAGIIKTKRKGEKEKKELTLKLFLLFMS
jgi:hypothetical protein